MLETRTVDNNPQRYGYARRFSQAYVHYTFTRALLRETFRTGSTGVW